MLKRKRSELAVALVLAQRKHTEHYVHVGWILKQVADPQVPVYICVRYLDQSNRMKIAVLLVMIDKK